MTQDLADVLSRGGPVIWLIAALSLLMVATIVWKVLQMARLGAWSKDAAKRALVNWEKGRTDAALASLDGSAGIRANLTRHAMTTRMCSDLCEAHKREEVSRAAKAHLLQARAGLRLLELVSVIAPLLGLFGTVLGMIATFQSVQDTGGGNIAGLAGGIWQALLTTAAGMGVAIPAGIALSWFEALHERLQADLEDAATRVFTRGLSG